MHLTGYDHFKPHDLRQRLRSGAFSLSSFSAKLFLCQFRFIICLVNCLVNFILSEKKEDLSFNGNNKFLNLIVNLTEKLLKVTKT